MIYTDNTCHKKTLQSTLTSLSSPLSGTMNCQKRIHGAHNMNDIVQALAIASKKRFGVLALRYLTGFVIEKYL